MKHAGKEITNYQKQCFANYKNDIGYSSKYKYLNGNPINVLVPIETPINKFMVVGAYPSAKFFTVNGISDTPLYDNDSPFSNESYFDGSRVRTIPSGEELNQVILKQIGISREDCWVTDLVKVFLFKEGHIKRYNKLGHHKFTENRSQFNDYSQKSLSWLYDEIELADPKLIILLGLEVISNVLCISMSKAKTFIDGEIKLNEVRDSERKFVCLPHPGILMKPSKKNPWPGKFEKEIAPKIKKLITKL